MGYWNQGADGSSLHTEETGLIWGDSPADVFDAAIADAVQNFHRRRRTRTHRGRADGWFPIFARGLVLRKRRNPVRRFQSGRNVGPGMDSPYRYCRIVTVRTSGGNAVIAARLSQTVKI